MWESENRPLEYLWRQLKYLDRNPTYQNNNPTTPHTVLLATHGYKNWFERPGSGWEHSDAKQTPNGQSHTLARVKRENICTNFFHQTYDFESPGSGTCLIFYVVGRSTTAKVFCSCWFCTVNAWKSHTFVVTTNAQKSMLRTNNSSFVLLLQQVVAQSSRHIQIITVIR